MDEAVKHDTIHNKYNEKYVEYMVLPEVASAASSANFETMGKAIKYDTIPYQQNKAYVKSDALPEGASGANY